MEELELPYRYGYEIDGLKIEITIDYDYDSRYHLAKQLLLVMADVRGVSIEKVRFHISKQLFDNIETNDAVREHILDNIYHQIKQYA